MIVICDFDGTITRTDTTRHFFFFLARKFNKSPLVYLLLHVCYRFGLMSQVRFKSALAHVYLRNRQLGDVRDAAREFYEQKMIHLLNTDMVETVKRHILEGAEILIASANFDILIECVCERLGVQRYVATRLKIEDGMLTGALDGLVLFGEEKVSALVRMLGAEVLAASRLYCDSEDAALINIVQDHIIVGNVPKKGCAGGCC